MWRLATKQLNSADVKIIQHPFEERLIYFVVESGTMRNVNKCAKLKNNACAQMHKGRYRATEKIAVLVLTRLSFPLHCN